MTQALPKPKVFCDPILLTILGHTSSPGQLTKLTPEIGKEVCQKAGFDPDRLDQYGDPNKGWYFDGEHRGMDASASNGFYRKIQMVYHQLGKRTQPLTIRENRGWWGLTDAGLFAARKLNPAVIIPPVYTVATAVASVASVAPTKAKAASKKAKNATARFLDKRFAERGSKLLETMTRYVAKNLPVSASNGTVMDHVNNCIVKLISRDALKSRIDAGEPIPDHHIATWAVRSAYGDIRNDGTEPVAREIHGARTERERVKKIALGDLTDDRIVWAKEGDRNNGAWVDIEDADSALTAIATEDAIQFDQVWGQIESLITAKRPVAGDRYLSILRMKALGMSTKEIAEAEGVSPYRATSLVAEARKTVQEGLKNRRIRG